MTNEEAKNIRRETGLGRRELHKLHPELSEGQWRKVITEVMIEDEANIELMTDETLAKLQQQKQAAQDTNIYLRRITRNENRALSIIEKLNEEFHDLFSSISLPVKIEHEFPEDNGKAPVLLVCLSDFHAQEEIKTEYNVYNFEILAKRLEKYAHKILFYAKAHGIKRIDISMLGDMVNSNRRVGEQYCNSTTSMKTVSQVAILIEQFILSLYNEYPVRVYAVCGNESRIDKEFDKCLITNNFDYSIYNLLKAMFRNCDNVEFIDGNFSYQVIHINGFNILAVHGDEFKQFPSQAVKLKKQQISEQLGIIIHFVIMGHYHSTLISGDGYARCSGICGSNPYSFESLGFSGDAEQTLIVIDDVITPIPINLQNTDKYIGYELDEKYLGV